MVNLGIDATNSIIFDEPVIYKGLKLYQCTLSNYIVFKTYQDCLSVTRAYEKNLDFLQIPYLEYIYRKYASDDERIGVWTGLNEILKITFQTDKFGYDDDSAGFRLTVLQDDNTFAISCQDFDVIKEIICQMNDVVLEDIDPEWEIELKNAQKKLEKIQGNDGAEFRDMVIAFGLTLNKLPNELKNVPISTFNRYISTSLDKEEYNRARSSELQGNTFKNKLTHWLSHYCPAGKYDNVISKNFKGNVLDKL